jgi:hypothetical protein
MKKTLALFGFVAMLAMMLVFTSCATTSAWWSGVWGAAVLLSPSRDVTARDEIVLEGTNASNVTGTLIRNVGTEAETAFELTDIDVSKKGFITFVVEGTEKQGTFDFSAKTITEIVE